MVPRTVRRHCENLVADLGVSAPLDMPALRSAVSRITGRPVAVRVMNMPPGGPYGFFATLNGRDLVFVTAGASADHRNHVELHELAHILLGHHGVEMPTAGVTDLVPDLDPALVERLLTRDGYDDEAEREAELLATMIACAATDWTPQQRRNVPATDAPIVDRIERDLSTWS